MNFTNTLKVKISNLKVIKFFLLMKELQNRVVIQMKRRIIKFFPKNYIKIFFIKKFLIEIKLKP